MSDHQPSSELDVIESQLRSLHPAPLSNKLERSLLDEADRRSSSRNRWLQAASIGLVGALVGLVVGSGVGFRVGHDRAQALQPEEAPREIAPTIPPRRASPDSSPFDIRSLRLAFEQGNLDQQLDRSSRDLTTTVAPGPPETRRWDDTL